ncbi:hypothetical protein BH708_07550 [Brachybacterium sp. P6-10-X1]|uniref:hypothetical protein n=1 Tax=Brachybacterium sp. P6-10-X1 TaxID=1903186 RepID=UPI000971ADAD|nr:hypothetical protein [Brachybacterium sp. P6-10-X1]APX32596.1 hypothetical protein BH708_07550 [Brachybacterium sp. P6-10-X1]
MTAARARTGAFVAGVLCANSLPHLATAVAGRRHLTPIGGRRSSRWINAAWGAANVAGGLALIARSAQSAREPRGAGRWDSRLVAFDLGAAVFAAWMAGSEAVLRGNWGDDAAPRSRS